MLAAQKQECLVGSTKTRLRRAAAGLRRKYLRRWNLGSSDALSVAKRTTKGTVMDKEHIKGAADKAKGAMKDAAGKVTGDKELQAEGKIDKAKGAAHSAVGDAKDAVKRAAS
jgi:uncharacterized protein YjbJ (UPF0337 family)